MLWLNLDVSIQGIYPFLHIGKAKLLCGTGKIPVVRIAGFPV